MIRIICLTIMMGISAVLINLRLWGVEYLGKIKPGEIVIVEDKKYTAIEYTEEELGDKSVCSSMCTLDRFCPNEIEEIECRGYYIHNGSAVYISNKNGEYERRIF